MEAEGGGDRCTHEAEAGRLSNRDTHTHTAELQEDLRRI